MSGKKGKRNIWDAAREGDIPAVRSALAAGADVNALEGKDSAIASLPLHQAAWGGHAGMVRFLLEAGADADAPDDGGNRPLHFAAMHDCSRNGKENGGGREEHPEVALLLLNAGAQVRCANWFGQTPLHIAARDNSPETAALLIEAGADVNAAGGSGTTPLHLAALNNQMAVAAVLLESGANPALVDEDGLTPLMRAESPESREGLEKAIAENATPELRKARMIGQWRERQRRLAALRPRAPSL